MITILKGMIFMKKLNNILWTATFGLVLAAAYALCGVVCAVSIVGLPVAKASFSLAKYLLFLPQNVEKKRIERTEASNSSYYKEIPMQEGPKAA